MKYLKYRFNNIIGKKSFKKRLKLLDKKNSRNYYVRKVLLALDFVLLVLIAVALIILCKYIGDIESISKGLKLFLLISVAANILILPIVIFGALISITYKLFPYCGMPKLNKQIVDECVEPLKKFYKIGDNFIVTKCYKCSVPELTNKDVLLFVHDGKLRIVNDFTTTHKDFGCYEISKGELEYCYKAENGLTAAYIKCDGIELLLGKRAKPFINRYIFDIPSK